MTPIKELKQKKRIKSTLSPFCSHYPRKRAKKIGLVFFKEILKGPSQILWLFFQKIQQNGFFSPPDFFFECFPNKVTVISQKRSSHMVNRQKIPVFYQLSEPIWKINDHCRAQQVFKITTNQKIPASYTLNHHGTSFGKSYSLWGCIASQNCKKLHDK